MPHSMDFESQSNKWFSILIFIGLPFLVLWRLYKDDLPNLRATRPPKK